MARHKQRDEEAGGEGLGIVDTRKRMWRDLNGDIVRKKPYLPASVPSPPQTQSHAEGEESMQAEQRQSHGQSLYDNVLLTPSDGPPIRQGNIDQPEQLPTDASSLDRQRAFASQTREVADDNPDLDMDDFLANSSWGMLPSQQTTNEGRMNHDGMFEDALHFDTGKEFPCRIHTFLNAEIA